MVPGQLRSGSDFAGKFRIERPLAEGGMGELFVVTQRSTGRVCALKLLNAEGVFDDEVRARFLAEARNTPQDASEHIVQVIDAGVTDGRPWILMELLDGQTLQDFVAQRGPLSVPLFLHVFGQICHGVGAAHAQGVVHRDLKPENVFVYQAKSAQGDLRVKVLDFGVAKALGPLRAHGTASIAVGTEGWWAPEQVLFGARLSPATDVWALGLLAYWCLTGRQFRDAGPHSSKFLSAASERAREQGVGQRIPRGFDAWFAQCVAWELSHRFVDANAAWRALEAALQPPTVVTPSMSPPTPPATPYTPTSSMPTMPPTIMTMRTTRLPSPRAGINISVIAALGVGVAAASATVGWWLVRTPSSDLTNAPPVTHTLPPSTPPPAPVPVTASVRRSLVERGDLQAFFGQWNQTLDALARGESVVVSASYADQTRFRGSGDTLRTRLGVGAYWDMFFHRYGGTIRFEWSRAEWGDEALDPTRSTHRACALVVGADPGVTLVRVLAVEDDPQSGVETTDGSRCTHLEGVYLLRARRVRGAFQICHESWSLEEAICPSCPIARQCASSTPRPP